MVEPGWGLRDFPRIDDASMQIREFAEAYCSRADSGRIYWDEGSPRAYVRGAVYSSENELVSESQRRGGVNSDVVLTVNPLRLTREERAHASAKRIQGTWLYVGNWMHIFGHFLVETLPMFWPALEEKYGPLDGVCAHRFNARERFGWQSDLVSAAVGDLPAIVIEEEPMRFERLLVGPRVYNYHQNISDRAVSVWDAAARRVATEIRDPAAKVFLSRSALGRAGLDPRAMRNASDVDDVFVERGFRVIHPELHSVEEQIALVRDAEVIAGQAGSALHLAAFSGKARVVELGDSRTRHSIVPTQRAIAAVRRQELAHVTYEDDGAGGRNLAHLSASLNALRL